MFDATVTLGNVLTIVGMGVAGIAFVLAMKGELRVFAQRLDKLESVMGRVTEALVELARQEVRLDAHADRIKNLEQERRP